MVKKSVLVLLGLLISPVVLARPLTLEELVHAVRTTHPAIVMAEQDAQMTRQQKKAETWIEDPEVEFMAEEIPYASPSLGNATMQQISIAQKIPFPGQLIQQAKSFNKEYAAKKTMIAGAEREVVFNAKKIYFELVAAEHEISEYSAIMASYKQMLGTMEVDYQSTGTNPGQSASSSGGGGGMGASGLLSSTAVMPQVQISDLYMVKMKKAETEAELHDAHHQRHALIAKINLLLGRDPSTSVHVVAPKTKTFKGDENALWERTRLQNSEIAAMRLLVSKAQSDVKVAKYSLVPGLGLRFAHDRRQNMDNGYTASVGFNIPLWFNRNAGTIGMAKADQARMQASLENTTRSVREDFHYLVEHARWHGKIISLYRGEILPNAKSAATTALASFQAGMENSTSVLNKLISSAQARVMYWKMWSDYMTEYAMLEKLVGEEL